MPWKAVLLASSIALLRFDPADAQVTAEQAVQKADQTFRLQKCDNSAEANIIVVCGADNSKFRLPIPIKRTQLAAHIPGDIPRAPTDAVPNRPCGVFAGQRRCNIRDLRAYGYGGGSVPIRAVIMLGKKLIDPGSELGPLGGYAIKPGEVGEPH